VCARTPVCAHAFVCMALLFCSGVHGTGAGFAVLKWF